MQIMEDKKATTYVQNLIEEFKVPSRDEITECMLAVPGNEPNWNAGVFIAGKQKRNSYADIFQFWVRAFFCFSENIWEGSLLWDIRPFIECHEVSSQEFQKEYYALIEARIPDDFFANGRPLSEALTELHKVHFSNCYRVLNKPDIKSMVAKSGEEFICFAIRNKPLTCSLKGSPV